MAIERVNAALAAFGAGTDDSFVLDKDGECVLEREGGGECVINAPAQGSAFTLSAVVGFMHGQDDPSMLAGLMQLNGDNERLRGGTVSLDESGEVIVYRYVVETAATSGVDMLSLVGNFFAVTDNLRKEIAKLRDMIDSRSVLQLHRHPAVHGYLRG